jgi:hypothetical protein
MHAITCPIHILCHRALQAEDDVIIRALQLPSHSFSKNYRTQCSPSFDRNLMHDHARMRALPALCVKMDLVTRLHQPREQPLEIQLSSADGGELAANESEFHAVGWANSDVMSERGLASAFQDLCRCRKFNATSSQASR